jgi:hypothetical protein
MALQRHEFPIGGIAHEQILRDATAPTEYA